MAPRKQPKWLTAQIDAHLQLYRYIKKVVCTRGQSLTPTKQPDGTTVKTFASGTVITKKPDGRCLGLLQSNVS